jgi:UrcA family protein
MNKLISIALAAVSIGAAAQPATARTDDFSIAVAYGDLNLASQTGAKTLEGRIKAAALSVCGATQAPGLVELKTVTDCRARIFEAARPQVEVARNDSGPGGTIAISAAMLGAR